VDLVRSYLKNSNFSQFLLEGKMIDNSHPPDCDMEPGPSRVKGSKKGKPLTMLLAEITLWSLVLLVLVVLVYTYTSLHLI
jgi:hypothetical protein